MRFQELARLRGQLNHDWLQNRYLTFLAARCGSGERYEWTAGYDRERVLEWKSKVDEFRRLSEGLEEALSPCQLLEEPPLCHLAQEHKEWLGPLVHELYCTRVQIRKRVTVLNARIEAVDNLVGLIASDGRTEVTAEQLYGACRELSAAISDLPNRIQIA